MPRVQIPDRREQQAVTDGDEKEIPIGEEAGAERERGELRRSSDRGPDRGLGAIDGQRAWVVYDLRFPCSSYS